jgi:hypothetical protein
LKASWYNEIGLNANYNMKREKLSTTESQMNNDALLPLVDQMLRSRQEAAEQINEMFGTDIHVEFASSWEKLVQEFEQSNQLDESEVNEDGDSESTEIESEVSDDSGSEMQRENGESETTESVSGTDDVEKTDDHEEVSDSDVSVEVDVEVNVGDESNQLDGESEVTDDEMQGSTDSDSELRDDDADE